MPPRGPCLPTCCGSMPAERRSSQTIWASVSQISPWRQARSRRECPRRRKRSGITRLKAEDARREYEKAMKEYERGWGESSKRDKSKKKKKVKVKMEKKNPHLPGVHHWSLHQGSWARASRAKSLCPVMRALPERTRTKRRGLWRRGTSQFSLQLRRLCLRIWWIER